MDTKAARNTDFLSTSAIIEQARRKGVDFGNGDPYNRIRYYTKIGLLPHASRRESDASRKQRIQKQKNGTSVIMPQTEGHYPTWVIDRLIAIDQDIKAGKSIATILKEFSGQKNTNSDQDNKKQQSKSNQISGLPDLRIDPYSNHILINEESTLHNSDLGQEQKIINQQTPIVTSNFERHKDKDSLISSNQAKQENDDSFQNLFSSRSEDSEIFPALRKSDLIMRNIAISIVLVLLLITGLYSWSKSSSIRNNNRSATTIKVANPLAAVLGRSSNIQPELNGKVLAARTPNLDLLTINADTTINGNLTAPNVIYSLTAGQNVTISGGQNPVISAQANSNDTIDTVTKRGNNTSNAIVLTGGLTANTLTVTGTTTIQGGLTLNSTLNLGTLTSDPTTTTNGTSYYNSSTNKFRCYQNGAWTDCITSQGGVTSLTGTANQITVSASTGDVTLSLPQNIATASSPTFAALTLSGATPLTFSATTPTIALANASTLSITDGTNTLASLADNGTTGTLTVANLTLNGLSTGTGNAVCVNASNQAVTCTTGSGGISGSGTSGQIAFFNGASSITSETSGFGWDTTNKLFTLTSTTVAGTAAAITDNSLNSGKGLSVVSTSLTTGKLVDIEPTFAGNGVTGYGLYITGSDSTANGNTDYNSYSTLALTGNAAKTGVGVYSTVSTSSTTADTIIGADLTTATSGVITTGTRNVYGLRSQPASTAASTGGTTNVYGMYANVNATVGAGGTVNGYGLYIANGTYNSTGTSTQYGAYIEAPTGAGTNYAEFVNGGNVVQRSNVNPVVKGSVADNTNLNAAEGIYVSGQYAYVAANSGNRLTVVDITNPASPVVVGNVNDATNLATALSVYVAGRYAYVTTNLNARLTVVDVSNPKSPTVVGSVRDTTNLAGAYGVVVSGRYAYVTSHTGNRLTVVDVSNPTSPAVVGNVNDATNLNAPEYFAVSGRYAYVADFTGKMLTVVDINNPNAPVVVGQINDATNLNGASDVYVSGRYAYVAATSNKSITVVDVKDPTAPSVVGEVVDATNLNGVGSVYVSGRYAYATAYTASRVTVVDINDPTAPVVEGSVNDNTKINFPFKIFVSGKYAYIVSQLGNRLTAIDISGIEAPAANIGNLGVNDITAAENIDVGNMLLARGGVNVGPGGIYSAGTVAASYMPIYSTAITTPSITDNLLTIKRAPTTNSSFASTLTVSGAVASISDNCTQTTGTCTDTANVLALTQSYASSSGAVLSISGAGTGNIGSLSTTNASANGLSLQVQSSSSSQYALYVSSNNGSTNDFYVRADGNVGIGTTGPSQLLQVNNSGTSSVVITSSGTVGIGLTNPAYPLDISSASLSRGINVAQSGAKTANDFGQVISNTSTSSTASITREGLQINSTGTWNGTSAWGIGLEIQPVTGGTNNAGLCFDCDGTWNSSTVASGIVFGTDSGATGIYRSGNNQISFGNGAQPFNIGQIIFGVSGTPSICIGQTCTNPGIIEGGAGLSIDTANAGSLAFKITGSEKFRLNSDGKIGIGVTAPISVFSNSTTDVTDQAGTGSSATSSLLWSINAGAYAGIFNNTNTGTSVGNGLLVRTTGTSTQNVFTADAGGTDIFNIYANGKVGVGTTNPGYKLDVQGGSINTSDNILKGSTYTSSSDATEFTTANTSFTSVKTWTVSISGDRIIKRVALTADLKNSGGTVTAALSTSSDCVETVGTTATETSTTYVTHTVSPTTTVATSLNQNLGYNGNVTLYTCLKASAGTSGIQNEKLEIEYEPIAAPLTRSATTDATAYTTTSATTTALKTWTVTISGDRIIKHITLTGDMSTTAGSYSVTLSRDASCLQTSTNGSYSVNSATNTSTVTRHVSDLGMSSGFLNLFGFNGNLTVYTCASVTGGNTVTVQNETLDVVYTNGDVEVLNVPDTTVSAGTVVAADLAENYVSAADLQPGTLVAIANDGNPKAVISTARSYQSNILGVVSTDPAITLNDAEQGDKLHPFVAPIALSGRVPVKVSTENGAIHSGDFITASSVTGVGMKATQPGMVVGQALQDLPCTTPTPCVSLIDVFVHTGYVDATQTIQDLMISQNGQLIDNATKLLAFRAIATNSLGAQDQPLQIGFDANNNFVIKTASGSANAVTFDSLGNATFSGTITAKGIKADEISGLTELIRGTIASPTASSSASASAVASASATPEATRSGNLAGNFGDLVAQSVTSLTTLVAKIIHVDQLDVAQDATIHGGLKVVGESAALPKTTVGGSLTVGTVSIDDIKASIDTFSGSLKLQSLGTGGVEFVGGKVIFDKDGKVLFKNDVTFSKAPTFGPDTAGTVTIKQGQESAEVTFATPYAATPVINANIATDGALSPTDASSSALILAERAITLIISHRTTNGFTIILSKTAPEDLTIDWTAIVTGVVQSSASPSPSTSPSF